MYLIFCNEFKFIYLKDFFYYYNNKKKLIAREKLKRNFNKATNFQCPLIHLHLFEFVY